MHTTIKATIKAIVAAFAAIVVISPAYAQHHPGGASPHQEAAASPFGIRVFGNFKRMMHTRDATGKVRLQDLAGAPGSYGVGALAGLRGEALLWDGKMLVSRGHSATGAIEAVRADDEAALFVMAQVPAWVEVPVPQQMSQQQFEAFVQESARRNALPAEQPFPFMVKGTFPGLVWHVVTGMPQGAGQGVDTAHAGSTHAQGHAQNRVFEQPGATGSVLGFYSGAALEGVISHPGERFHLHYADEEFGRSGHVDSYVVGKGATLLLPASARR